MMKNPRFLVWILFVVISLMLIAPNPFPSGFVITHIDENSTITGAGISYGDKIYKINGEGATKQLLENKEYYDIVSLDTSRGSKLYRANGTLGIRVEEAASSNLKFGLDIKGGIRALIVPNTTDNATIEQTVSTLQTRINLYGLRESTFRPIYYEKKGFIEISIAGGNEAELRELLERQGRFEARIPLVLDIKNNMTSVQLDKKYDIAVSNESVSVSGQTSAVGSKFSAGGIDFVVDEIDDKLNLTAIVYKGSDVKTVYFDPQRSRIERLNNGYRWSFSIQLSNEGAQRFAWVTQNIPRAKEMDRIEFLESKIYLYLDDKLIDALNIAHNLRGKSETEILITGSSASIDEASKEKSKLQSILRSGSLPASIEIAQLDTISPNLGSDFLKNAFLAGIAAVLGVTAVVLVRYRKIKVILPMVVTAMSEVLIILGASVMIGWTIDLAAIAGIIAAVGTGIDSQIIMIDQVLRKEAQLETLKEKLKHAFFIIFGAGGVIIAAMLPLMTLGFGMLRGFAITTIIGVLSGILITRPAFGVVIERLMKE